MQRLGKGVLDGLNDRLQEIADKARDEIIKTSDLDAAKDDVTDKTKDWLKDKLPEIFKKVSEDTAKKLSEFFGNAAKGFDIGKEYKESLEEIVKRDAELKKMIKENPNIDPYDLGKSFGADLGDAFNGLKGIFKPKIFGG